jgi:hypothetical protein
VSLAAALYDAAGKPQGHYACVVLVEVYYSVFESWCNTQSDGLPFDREAIDQQKLRDTGRRDHKSRVETISFLMA